MQPQTRNTLKSCMLPARPTMSMSTGVNVGGSWVASATQAGGGFRDFQCCLSERAPAALSGQPMSARAHLLL